MLCDMFHALAQLGRLGFGPLPVQMMRALLPVYEETTPRVCQRDILAVLVFGALYNSLDVLLDAVLVYQSPREVDAGLFEIAAGTGDAVERVCQVCGLPADVALHALSALGDIAACCSVG